jgi:hypothetical protein
MYQSKHTHACSCRRRRLLEASLYPKLTCTIWIIQIFFPEPAYMHVVGLFRHVIVYSMYDVHSDACMLLLHFH